MFILIKFLVPLLLETCFCTYMGCNTFCWVLQAFVLKYILFSLDELSKSQFAASNNFASLTEDAKAR